MAKPPKVSGLWAPDPEKIGKLIIKSVQGLGFRVEGILGIKGDSLLRSHRTSCCRDMF